MASIQELLTNVKVGETTIFDIAREKGPNGADQLKVIVEQRRLLPEEPRAAKRQESPARRHEFLAAASLGAYLAKYSSDDAVVYADPANEVMYSVLNEKAKDGFETVTMKPGIHPLWKPWADLAGKKVPLAFFADFIDQNRRVIVAPDSRELRMLLSQVRASVNIEIERGRGKSAVNGIMCRTKIQGVEKNEPAELPETVTIEVPLFIDTTPKKIDLDLSIEASSDGLITVVVSAGTVAEARVAAFDEMVDIVERESKGKATVTYGRPSHVPWVYLSPLPPS